jgi:hypothetical protein
MPSRVIRSFGYDADSRRLFIVFQTGRRYTYEDVPVETYEAMKGSFSRRVLQCPHSKQLQFRARVSADLTHACNAIWNTIDIES